MPWLSILYLAYAVEVDVHANHLLVFERQFSVVKGKCPNVFVL
jgi:hypothetical protein